MSIDLKDFSATMAVGLYVAVAASLAGSILFNFRPLWIVRSLRRPLGRLGQVALCSGTIFSLGMLAEDLSDKFVDRDGWLSDADVLPRESSLRADCLTGSRGANALATDLGRAGAFGIQTRTLDLDGLVQVPDPPESTTKRVRDAANGLYYRAKNNVYREETYFKELSSIQLRIDFARSMAVLSVAAGVIFGMALGCRGLTWGVGWVVSRVSPRPRTRTRLPLEGHRRRWIASAIALGGFLIVYVSARFAYCEEESEFNNRVYGYYASGLESGLWIRPRGG